MKSKDEYSQSYTDSTFERIFGTKKPKGHIWMMRHVSCLSGLEGEVLPGPEGVVLVDES